MTLSEKDLDDLSTNIGIDSIGFYAPNFYLALENLAQIRDINPLKFKFGLMVNELRFPDYGEDSISLGIKAAYNALIRGDIDPKEIDAVFVGTESTVYAVKSISNIFKDLLGISDNCLTQDISNACAAGSLAILNAISMIEKGIVNKALVITVDISKYKIKSRGEPTQGAGAIALVLTRNPRIAVFGKYFGKVSANINDFYRAPGENHAEVFGQYSVASYLDFQLKAFDDLISKTGQMYMDYYIFHAPYAKLPLKFMQKLMSERAIDKIGALMRHDSKKRKIFNEIEFFSGFTKKNIISDEIKNKIKLKNCSKEKKEEIEDWIYNKIYNNCLPPLQVPNLFGNMYNASIWAELMFLLENYVQAGDTIYFGSYGSGATAISGFLKIQPEFKSVLANSLGISRYFHNKTQISVKEYEKIRNNSKNPHLIWGKIKSKINIEKYSFNLKYCDEGCNLSRYKNLDYCPKGHSGSNMINFPIVGTVIAIKEYKIGEITPMKNGYFLMQKDVSVGDIVEFELRRWKNIKESNPKPGLLNWIPIYRNAKTSPYLGLADEKGLAEVEVEENAFVFSSGFNL